MNLNRMQIETIEDELTVENLERELAEAEKKLKQTEKLIEEVNKELEPRKEEIEREVANDNHNH